ncbi:hypothetical protein NFI96_012219 [Prochilodus magdalenae]|nr:hypothetical protein NFI96_012219 [Prochilodus magdalenae]
MLCLYRCQSESLQRIRKTILDSLNLQAEPRVSVPSMAVIRDQWKTAFKSSSQSKPMLQITTENQTSFEHPSPANSTLLRCCKLASQIFLTDLGWNNWIIYPESFTYIQCCGCDQQVDQNILCCRENLLPSSQVQCCEPTIQDLVPFLYLDETSSLVIASVPLTRECGCGPSNIPQVPKL